LTQLDHDTAHINGQAPKSARHSPEPGRTTFSNPFLDNPAEKKIPPDKMGDYAAKEPQDAPVPPAINDIFLLLGCVSHRMFFESKSFMAGPIWRGITTGNLYLAVH
jgi:hypothetical protein